MSLSVRHGEPFAAFCPAGSQYPATILGCHALSVTVLILSSPNRGLICPFHYSKYFSVRITLIAGYFLCFRNGFYPASFSGLQR